MMAGSLRWVRLVVVALVGVALLAVGSLNLVQSFQVANGVAHSIPDPSFHDTTRAVAASGGLGPEVADQLAAIVGSSPAGRTFALATDRDISAGEVEALSQVSRFALFPALLVSQSEHPAFVLRARSVNNRILLRVSEAPVTP